MRNTTYIHRNILLFKPDKTNYYPIYQHEVIVVREDSEKFHIIFFTLRHLETYVDAFKVNLTQKRLNDFREWFKLNKVRVEQVKLEPNRW